MKILVVDDEKNIRETIIKYLKLENLEATSAANGLSACRMLEEEHYEIAIIDLKMPGMDGLELLSRIKERQAELSVIMMSAFGEINDAVTAMKGGAVDYIVKPFDPEELLLRVKRLIKEKKVSKQVEAGRLSGGGGEGFVGKSAPVMAVKRVMEKVAPTISNVLITGESGTGKEVAARLIHDLSGRKEGPFVAVNVGGMPEQLLESELFGYEKGAFTGAASKKQGLFEVASGGTIFLDEIGDMPLSLQVKLLRVLQEKKIQPLGSTSLVPVDVRVLSATNRNLEEFISEGKFREDLYFRLNVVKIHLPPLRERIEDIPLLIGYFIEKFNGTMGRRIEGVDSEALELLKGYDFPGNIRELANIIERAFIFCEGDSIGSGELEIKSAPHKAQKRGTLKEMEREAILDALRRWEGNRTRAAEELGFTRRTLLNKIKEFGIEI